MYRIPAQVLGISFDIWRTLLGGNKAFTRPRLQLLFKLLGHDELDVESLVKAYTAADKFCNNEAEIQECDMGLRDRLVLMYRVLGIEAKLPGDKALAAIQRDVAHLRLQPEFMPRLLEDDLLVTLKQLRADGYRLGLLSNTGIDNEYVMEQVLRKLGMWDLFDVHLFSCEDGRAKPNPGLFGRMASEFNLTTQEVLHVGDNINADYRATEAGLHAVVYDPTGSNYPHIRSMKELLNK